MRQSVAGGPRLILRLEALLVLIAALVSYSRLNFDWPVFFWCFLLPDISLAAYLLGPKIGAAIYNLAHSLVLPVTSLMIGFALDAPLFWLISLIWIAHIGLDRSLGFGLKYSESFSQTHLGLIGKKATNNPEAASSSHP